MNYLMKQKNIMKRQVKTNQSMKKVTKKMKYMKNKMSKGMRKKGQACEAVVALDGLSCAVCEVDDL